eukprot:gene61019-81355_t
MRQRQRSLDVAGNRFGCGVRNVVDRQNDYMVAHADSAVFTPITQEAPLDGRHAHHLLMFAGCDGGYGTADVDAIFHHRRADAEIADRELMTDWNVAQRGHGDFAVTIYDPAAQRLARPHAFDDDNTNRVVHFVDQEINHARSPCVEDVDGCKVTCRSGALSGRPVERCRLQAAKARQACRIQPTAHQIDEIVAIEFAPLHLGNTGGGHRGFETIDRVAPAFAMRI